MPAHPARFVIVASLLSNAAATRRFVEARARCTRSLDEAWYDLSDDPAFTCAATRSHLHEYVDGELNTHDPAERQIRESMIAHLSHCDRCARLEAQLRSMRLALAAVGARTRQPAVRRTPADLS